MATKQELEAQIESLKAQLKDKEAVPVVEKKGAKTVTLISEAKIRVFYIDPKHIVKIVRGCREQKQLKDTVIAVTPGSVVEVTEEYAKNLLTYKTFKVYGV